MFAVRDASREQTFAGLPELIVGGPGRRSGPGTVGLGHHWRPDEQVVERILAETRGNPLALLELPRGLSVTSWPADSA